MAPLPGLMEKKSQTKDALVDSKLETESVDVEEAATGQILPLRTSWKKNLVTVIMYLFTIVIQYLSTTGAFGATNEALSKKYQTVVTPAAWAFSIWGVIFIWEGVFAVAQFLPRCRSSKIVSAVAPWWWGLCIVQAAWTLVFAQEQIFWATVLMLGILASLLGISWVTSGMELTAKDYFLFRAPFSVQLGWIVAASVVSINVAADASKWSQDALRVLAYASDALVLIVVAIFTFIKNCDPIIGFVAAWAFAGIYSELSNPVNLHDKTRFNAQVWNVDTIRELQTCALCASLMSAVLATYAATKACRKFK